MAYRITLALSRLSGDEEPLSAIAETPEEAAAIAWELCEEHNLGLPNQSWKVQDWDVFAGAYEDVSSFDAMVRGGLGTYPRKTDFGVYVVDKLNKRSNNQSLLSGMTPEPQGPNKCEMFRGQDDRLTIVFDSSAKQSKIEPIALKIDEAIQTITDKEELATLIVMLENKLEKARGCLKEMGDS